MHPMLNIAIQAARLAGNFIAKHYDKHAANEASKKDNNALVTNCDLAVEAESLMVAVIRKYYPQHVIIGEESGELLAGEDHDQQWIIDPLNGTTNFINRFPYFAVSIAVCIKGQTKVAVVYDPMRNELFTAIRAQSAQLNGYRLRCGAARNLNGAILATSFKPQQHHNATLALVNKLLMQCADFRHTGSAALDLAYVAAGRVDGFFAIVLKPWALAGGELLVQEAGGLVTNVTGGHNSSPRHIILAKNASNNILVAGNQRMVKTMLATLLSSMRKITQQA